MKHRASDSHSIRRSINATTTTAHLHALFFFVFSVPSLDFPSSPTARQVPAEPRERQAERLRLWQQGVLRVGVGPYSGRHQGAAGEVLQDKVRVGAVGQR